MVTLELVLNILEGMPTSTKHKLKIGENDYALEQLRKTQPKLTMQDIRDHNIEMDGFADGYKDAVSDYKKWRNEVYLKLKEMD